MSKRALIWNSSQQIKKQKQSTTEVATTSHKSSACSKNEISNASSSTTALSATHCALLTIRALFPVKRFFNKLPPVIMLHQIYDLISSRTTVDREIKLLQNAGKICIFKLGVEVLARAVILTDDLLETSKKCFPGNTLIEKFLNFIVPLGVIDIDRNYLEQTFSLKEIRELMHCGFLVLSNEHSYLLSFPNAGHFMKAYTRGRKAVLQIIKKSKHGERLQNDLEDRNLDKTVVLGTKYHIHDVIGADLVKNIETTSGRLLRLNVTSKRAS